MLLVLLCNTQRATCPLRSGHISYIEVKDEITASLNAICRVEKVSNHLQIISHNHKLQYQSMCIFNKKLIHKVVPFLLQLTLNATMYNALGIQNGKKYSTFMEIFI